jgi:hypothetical protein
VLHELAVPIVALRGSLDFAKHELASKDIRLSEDWIQEAWTCTEFMVQMIQNAEIIANRDLAQPAVNLGDIKLDEVAKSGAMQAMRLLPKEFSSNNMANLNDLKMIPSLRGDRELLTQLWFNLFWFSLRGSRKSKTEVLAEATEYGWRIFYRNHRPIAPSGGNPLVSTARIPEEVLMSKKSSAMTMALIVGREIMRQHGGEIEISETERLTQIILFFPERLFESRF